MKCRHCGKRIKSFNNYRGEEDWTHEDQMTGMWCRLKAAEPEPENVAPVSDAGDLTVRKIGHRVTVLLDDDGTPLWLGERMVEVAPGEWMTQGAADFWRVTAELGAAIDESML